MLEHRDTFDPKMYLQMNVQPKNPEDVPVIDPSYALEEDHEVGNMQAPVPYDEVVNADYNFE